MRRWLSVVLLSAAAMRGETAPVQAQSQESAQTPAPATPTPGALESDPKGWKELMPKDASLKGWERVPAGRDTSVSAENQWSYDKKTKLLVCSGKGGHDYLHYMGREYSDFILHVEWRFVPAEGNPRYNSGVMIRDSADGKVWHQAQTGQAGGFLFADSMENGERKRINTSKEMRENRIKPVGEWNTYEVTAKGPKISLWANGAIVSEMSVGVPKGYIGFEGEGFHIEFRNVRIKELK